MEAGPIVSYSGVFQSSAACCGISKGTSRSQETSTYAKMENSIVSHLDLTALFAIKSRVKPKLLAKNDWNNAVKNAKSARE